ncbi:NHLP-related RiPP peptide [Dokdonella immobilis]|uniref:Putative modified peptide n=1 Tax=Dokdonella immobilis TaxID=578942 RepID=A0A1I4XT13_9GAMM|nr:NHLP-related RiPP peptide [Dokdonella immobilis]SFN29001.1 putative modified peptide [Dokdonella immobilis]
MNSTRLQKEHELNLLKKLSTDDAYRARFEASPSDALKEIGVPDGAVSSLDAQALLPGKLATKDEIARAHAKLDAENLTDHACMVWPLLRVNYGESSGPKSD